MLIKVLPVGQLETNCYIITNEETLESVVIDPGDESNTILFYLEDNNLTCKAILITHGHFDHIGALDGIREELSVPVYINSRDAGHIKDYTSYDDGDVINLAGIDFKILATPGHTAGGVTILAEDAIFCGDTLFKGSCGRTDLEGGNIDDLMRSLKKLCSIEGDYEVYPGHMDATSLERERELNYYCRKAQQNY